MQSDFLNHKVLFVTHKYPPSTGGMQKQSFELIEFAKKQCEIEAIIYRSNYPKIFFLLTVTLRTFIKVLSDSKIQLVHANDGLMALFLTPLILIRRVQLCATIHGLDVVFNFAPYQWWTKKYLSMFSFLIAVSEATQEECIQRGVPKEKVQFIPNAVELPDLVEKDPSFVEWLEKTYQTSVGDQLIISSVGRPVPRKGFGWFAKNVLPSIPNAKYLVVGTEMESSGVIHAVKRILPSSIFEKLCKMLGVPLDTIALTEIANNGDQLVLMGKVPYDKLLQTYLHTDIFVMPNLHVKGDFEGFGLVALEAGVFGAVCLAANVDGIPSAIKDGENGYLLESENASAWIEKIAELREDQQLSKAKATFENYYESMQVTWEEVGTCYLKLFEERLKA